MSLFVPVSPFCTLQLRIGPISARLQSVVSNRSFRAIFSVLLFLTVSPFNAFGGSSEPESLRSEAVESLERAVAYFRTLAIRGGYVHIYDLTTGQRWGEGPTDSETIEVQPPGTPSVGMAFLTAFKATGNQAYLNAAKEAAEALIAGQNDLGGWEHTIRFDRPKRDLVSFDDDQTQSAIRFLVALDQESNDSSLHTAVDKALEMLLKSQFDNGAWPHRYPKQGNYHDFATFNDGGINDCILVMQNAHKYYGKPEYLTSLLLAGGFLLLSQLPPPQPGWAQQYNQYLQPAWARSYEPPSVCPLVTLRNIKTLLDLASYTKDQRYLEPISDALTWMAEVRLPTGLWPRFVELGTNQPLYYDRGRIRVKSVEELQIERRTGYSYEVDLSDGLAQESSRYEVVKKALKKGSTLPTMVHSSRASDALIRKIISAQDADGKWVSQRVPVKIRTKGEVWQGEYDYHDQVRSGVFVDNVNALCDYIERTR
jgi:hypothetical protein